MKLNATKIKEAAAWVEAHGLYPQPFGASIDDFCKAMGIGRTTYKRWSKMDQMADALNHAREKFRAATVREVSNATIAAAKGWEQSEVKEEGKAMPETVETFDPATGKLISRRTSHKMVTVKATRRTVSLPPDINAAKLVLTNLDPEHWKLKQQVEHAGEVKGVNIVVESEDAAAALRQALEVNKAE